MTLRDLYLLGVRVNNVYLKTDKDNEVLIKEELIHNYYDYNIVFANGKTRTVIIQKEESK